MNQKDCTRQLVLVVDDNAHIRNAVRDILNTINVDVIHARNGREGLLQFSAYQDKIDAVVLDIHMPHLNGDDVLTAIRQQDPTMPVLVSSSYMRTDAVVQQLEEQQVTFLRKPYTFRSLITEVEKMLNTAENRSADPVFR